MGYALWIIGVLDCYPPGLYTHICPYGARRGEVLEWLKRYAWKAYIGGNFYQGFESPPLRQQT